MIREVWVSLLLFFFKLNSGHPTNSALFLVILDRLGTCSVMSTIYGPRVALWNFGKGARLIHETAQVGVNQANVKQVAQGNFQVAVLVANGEIKRLHVPLHLALSDQNSPRLADLAAFKEVSQELRRPEPNKDEVHMLMAKLRLLATKRQAVEKIISSEKFDLDEIRRIIASVSPDNTTAVANERKENRDFDQWLARLNGVVHTYATLTNHATPDEPVVDSLNLFPMAMRKAIATTFELLDNLSQMSAPRVKFSTKSQSLTLYDFSRCFTQDQGAFKLHRAISTMRKQSLSMSLFSSAHLAELCGLLLLSTTDYFELLFNYIQTLQPNLGLMATFIRLIGITGTIFPELDVDWRDRFRIRLEEGHPINGMLFTAAMIYVNHVADADSADTLDWSELITTDRWAESLENQHLAASVFPLCVNMGDLEQAIFMSTNQLKSHGSCAITELVADWLVSWSLTPNEKPHQDGRVALVQIYIFEFLVTLFPKSLDPPLLNVTLFWTALSSWSNQSKRNGKTIDIVLATMERLGDCPHLASGVAAFVWKTLLAKKFEQVSHDLSAKRAKFGTMKTTGQRTESPTKIDQALTVIGGILDIMLAYDIDETPAPDISTELTLICHSMTHRKPSIGEIALNQPPPNPVLVRLHCQLLTTIRLNQGLKLSTGSAIALFDERDQLQFFKPLDRAHQPTLTPFKVGQIRRAYFNDVIGELFVSIFPISVTNKSRVDRFFFL